MKGLTILFLLFASIVVVCVEGRLQTPRRIRPHSTRTNQSSPFPEDLIQNEESTEKLNNDEHGNKSEIVYKPFKNVKSSMIENNRIEYDNEKALKGSAVCPDRDIARFVNAALTTYIHDMDGLSRYILNQIIASRKPGKWLVHSQVISGSRQGRDWQTSTNSDIFSQKDQYACFYHDNLTYILVLRVY